MTTTAANTAHRAARTLRACLAWADWALDNIPTYEDGRWLRHGDWGCRMRLHTLWWNDTDYEERAKPTRAPTPQP